MVNVMSEGEVRGEGTDWVWAWWYVGYGMFSGGKDISYIEVDDEW